MKDNWRSQSVTARVIQGDCILGMQSLPESCVNCVVTSPPYWGLRDYGVGGQIGLEQSPDEYVSRLVAVFREVHRVLRDDGVLWLNLGDTYNNFRVSTDGQSVHKREQRDKPRGRRCVDSFLKEKDLVGIPWRAAFALQADGWYLRQDIIWHKPNPMPESVRDRCTKSHEYVFMLTKSERYFYDSDAVREPLAQSSVGRAVRKKRLMDRTGVGTTGKQVSNGVDASHGYAGLALGRNGKTGYDLDSGMRNRRSVWQISTRPYKGAHFATMPPQLAEICIAAGSQVGGVVLDPFAGSGTTLAVALSMGRSAVGCELNEAYVALAEQRIKEVADKLPLFVDTDR